MANEKQQVMGGSREFRVGDHKRNGEVPQGEIGQLAKGYVETWLRTLPARAMHQRVDDIGQCDVRVTVTMSVERDAPGRKPEEARSHVEVRGKGDSDGGSMESMRRTASAPRSDSDDG